MTVFLTVLSGVITFVLGQLILKLLVDPVNDFRRTVADVALSLIEYANIYSNGAAEIEIERKASEEFRRLSSRLNAQMYLIPCYRCTAKLFGLPSRDKVVDSAKNLIGLSNGVLRPVSDGNVILVNLKRANEIRNALGIFSPEN